LTHQRERTGVTLPHARNEQWETGFGYLLRRSHRLFARELAKRLAAHEMPVAQFQILRVLWQHDGLSQTELSEHIEVERSALTGVFDDLERRGIVRRKRSASDRRRLTVHLTKFGRSLHDPLMAAARSVNETAARGVKRSDVRNAIATIEALIENLQRAED
jgi:DNA-binding MarR family transcriptional regulator